MTEAARPIRSFVRSFVAVPIPVAAQAALADAAIELARTLPGVKWTRKPEHLHVTMKFLGPVAPERLEALAGALGDALAEVPRFELALRGFGAFPTPRVAKVLFAGVADVQNRLAVVAELVETVAAGLGFAREERRFHGHVTVGRSKGVASTRAPRSRRPADRSFGSFFGSLPVDVVDVYESQLGGEGSTYVLRHRARLRAWAN